MSDSPNGLRWQVGDHERRLANVEKLELAVVVNRLTSLEKRVDAMTKALWATAGSLIIAAVTLALSLK